MSVLPLHFFFLFLYLFLNYLCLRWYPVIFSFTLFSVPHTRSLVNRLSLVYPPLLSSSILVTAPPSLCILL